jgi:Ni/Fe-hydrogenase subunit HybB-like protein
MGKFYDFFTNIYNNISLVPTILYNISWIYLFHNLTKSLTEDSISQCQSIQDWNYYGLYLCLFSLFKGIFLVYGITTEKDNSNHQFFFLLLKIFSGVIISSFIGYKFYFNSRESFSDADCRRNQTYHYFFSMFELTYAIFFYSLCCCIFLNTLRKKDDCTIDDEKEY